MSTQKKTPKAITINTLAKMKQDGEKIACLTAYDYCSAHACAEGGIDVILVGDSLGMVIQGHDSSLPVTIADMAYHVRCVKRGKQHCLLMADMPFMSYYEESQTLKNAATLMREGAHMVKLEGGAWLADSTKLLTQHGIPVCAHMGLTPQSVNHLGGYRVQGRNPEDAQKIVDEALLLQEAGANVILLECVPASLGKRVSEALEIPVIGIGAGVDVDGQILVWHDLLGLWPGKPAKFVKNFLVGNVDGVGGAVGEYAKEIKRLQFPKKEHIYIN